MNKASEKVFVFEILLNTFAFGSTIFVFVFDLVKSIVFVFKYFQVYLTPCLHVSISS